MHRPDLLHTDPLKKRTKMKAELFWKIYTLMWFKRYLGKCIYNQQ